jgi:hypothetical protein
MIRTGRAARTGSGHRLFDTIIHHTGLTTILQPAPEPDTARRIDVMTTNAVSERNYRCLARQRLKPLTERA